MTGMSQTRPVCYILLLLATTLNQVMFVRSQSLELRFFRCEDLSNYLYYLEHPDSCQMYVRCVGNQPVEHHCASDDLVFNEDMQECVFRFSKNDLCTSKNAERECGFISKKGGNKPVYIPHTTACHRYFNCSNREPHHRYSPFQMYETECPYPTYWDIEREQCLNYNDVTCRSRFPPKWVCDYLSFSCKGPNCSPCYIHHPSCSDKVDGLWPNPIFKWSPYFVECIGERSKTTEQMKCPLETKSQTEQVFHPTERKCVPLWVVPEKHGGLEPVCGTRPPDYYQLKELDVITYSCPGEVIFYCELPYPGHHDISRCEMMVEKSHKCAEGLWPSFSKLWSEYYVECHDGQYSKVEKVCNKTVGYTQLFHPVLRKCLSPWYIPREKGGVKPSCAQVPPGEYQITGYSSIKYRCPGVLLLHCHSDSDGGNGHDTDDHNDDHDVDDDQDDDDRDDDHGGKEHYSTGRVLITAQDKKKTSECDYLNDYKVNVTAICHGKMGQSDWPIPDQLWTPKYVKCAYAEQTDNDPRRLAGDEKYCHIDNGVEHVFHPHERVCVPRWQLTPEHGGFIVTCDCKSEGYTSFGSFSIKCPDELKFVCNPPRYEAHNDELSMCTELQ